MVRVRCQDELPPPDAQQVVFPHDPLDSFVIHLPISAPQLFGHTPPAIGRELLRDALNVIAQVQVPVNRLQSMPPAIKPCPANPREPTQIHQGNQARRAHFVVKVRVDEVRVVNACSLRCSSTRCKHRRKKSISIA